MRRLVTWTATAAAAYAAYAAVCPAARVWGPGFHRGPRTVRRIALTFDDGPSNETEHVLDLLAEHNARATFFVCGANVERRPETARLAAALGHEIGNHTHTHRCLLRLGPDAVYEEVSRAQRAIEDYVGTRPRLFRPPYGVRSPWLPAALAAEGLLSVHWSVIGMDWKFPADRIAARVLRWGAEPGAVICLHDGDRIAPMADRRATTTALRTIVPELLDQGFELVTASELAVEG